MHSFAARNESGQYLDGSTPGFLDVYLPQLTMTSAAILLHPDPQVEPRHLNITMLYRAFKTFAAGIEYVRRKPNRVIVVSCAPDYPAIKDLLKLKTINNVNIEVTAPEDISLKKGIISHPELKLLTDEELGELLQGRQLIFAKKVSVDTTVLTWKSADIPEGLPQHIVLGWDTVKIRPFLRCPVRCYFCQRYGHVASACQ